MVGTTLADGLGNVGRWLGNVGGWLGQHWLKVRVTLAGGWDNFG